MPLINITDIQNGDAANEELFNSRFAKIVDVINGKLDDSNIADSGITTPKIATDAVTGEKIASLFAEIQEDTTDSTNNNIIVQTGWGKMTPSGSDPSVNETVTFPETFGAVYSVIVTPHVKSDGTSGIEQFTGAVSVFATSENITTTSFQVRVTHYEGSNLVATEHGYSWLAIGSKA